MMRPDPFKQAMRHLDSGNAFEAMQLAQMLVDSAEESNRVAGYLCRGLVFEEGGLNFERDIEKAISSYRQAAVLVPDSITFGYLARASMKKGPGGFPDAWKFLVEANQLRATPEVDLGFAEYYRLKPNPDLHKARKYFLRAALHGRFGGFFGYSEVSRELGQRVRAIVVDILRVLLGPVIALLIGAKAQGRF